MKLIDALKYITDLKYAVLYDGERIEEVGALTSSRTRKVWYNADSWEYMHDETDVEVFEKMDLNPVTGTKIKVKDASKYSADNNYAVCYEGQFVRYILNLTFEPDKSQCYKVAITDTDVYLSGDSELEVFKLVTLEEAGKLDKVVKYIESKKYLLDDAGNYDTDSFADTIENIHLILTGKLLTE